MINYKVFTLEVFNSIPNKVEYKICAVECRIIALYYYIYLRVQPLFRKWWERERVPCFSTDGKKMSIHGTNVGIWVMRHGPIDEAARISLPQILAGDTLSFHNNPHPPLMGWSEMRGNGIWVEPRQSEQQQKQWCYWYSLVFRYSLKYRLPVFLFGLIIILRCFLYLKQFCSK